MSQSNSNEIFVCPISLEPIKGFAGITDAGQVYQYEEIKKWIEKNDTDPATGQILSDLEIKKIKISKKKEIEEYIANRRKHYQTRCDGWNIFRRKYILLDDTYKIFLENKGKVELHFIGTELWDEHQEEARALLRAGIGERDFYNHYYKDIFKPIRNCQYVEIINEDIKDKDLKHCKFDCGAIKDTTFSKCHLGRCTFMGVEFENVRFIDCSFPGEEVNFYKAKFKNVTFRNCRMEGMSWAMEGDLLSLRSSLRLRGVEGDIVIQDDTLTIN